MVLSFSYYYLPFFHCFFLLYYVSKSTTVSFIRRPNISSFFSVICHRPKIYPSRIYSSFIFFFFSSSFALHCYSTLYVVRILIKRRKASLWNFTSISLIRAISLKSLLRVLVRRVEHTDSPRRME